MLEPSLQEFLIFISRTVKHLGASSLCLPSLALCCPRRLMLIYHVWHILWHAKEIVCQGTDILRWYYLVHTDVEVLRLLEGLWVVLWGRSCSWNHWTDHVHSMPISLCEWVLHWLVHHELPCSSALVKRMVSTMVVLCYSLWGLSWEHTVFLFILWTLLLLKVEVVIVFFEVLLRWHRPGVSPTLY